MLLLPVLQRVIDGSQKTTVALPIHKALMIVMMEPMLRPTTMMSLFTWDLNLQKTKRPWEEECDNEKVQLKTIGTFYQIFYFYFSICSLAALMF